MRKSISIITILHLLPMTVIAADKQASNVILDWAYNNILILLAALVLVAVSGAIWNTMETMVEVQRRKILQEKGLPITNPPKVKKESAFSKIYNKLLGMVPIDQENDIDLGHEYDGIRELDNSLPPWWLYLFYFTIAFGGIYLYIYHFSDIGLSQKEEYETAMEIAEEQRRQFLRTQANAVDESNVIALYDAKSLAAGGQIFKSVCAACHGQLGEGGVGPNMTDPYWIHGGSISDVFKTIKYGVPEKGMISWQKQMQPVAMQQLSSYVLSLQGTNPPNAKEPQGELYEQEDPQPKNEAIAEK